SATLSSGKYVEVWQDRSPPTTNQIEAQIFNADGSRFGSAVKVNTTGTNPDIPFVAALADGHFVVTWYDNTTHSLRGQYFNSDATTSGQEFTIGSPYDTLGPVTALPDGRFVVAYSLLNAAGNDVDVQFQIFDPRTA